MRIAVYCSARENLPEAARDDARRLGEWIGRNGHTLVYGGLSYGLMENVAQTAREAGAQVIGVVPESRIEKICPANTENVMCRTLHERKQQLDSRV